MSPFCLCCGEGFDEPMELLLPLNGGTAVAHQACVVRAVVGGVNHQRRTCSCWGGTEPSDPPELTPREAAREAMLFFHKHGGSPAEEEAHSSPGASRH